MNNCGYVKYVDILNSLHPLSLVLSDLYGPICGKVLMKKSTGEVSITNDGSSVLQSLATPHPIANLIKNACLKHHKNHGDNAKAYLLMVEAAIMYLHKENLTSNRAVCFLHRHNIKKSLVWFSDNIINNIKVHDILLEHIGIFTNVEEDGIKASMENIVRTFITGKFANEAETFLAELVMEVLSESCLNDFKNIQPTINYYLNNIDQLVLEVPGPVFYESKLLKGVLINQTLSKTKMLPEIFKGVIVTWNNNFSPQSYPKINSSHMKDLQECISYPILVMLRWIQTIKSLEINLILHQGKATDALKGIFIRNDIYVLDCLQPEQINFLTRALDVLHIGDITEEVHPSLLFSCKLSTLKSGIGFYTLLESEKFSAKKVLPCSIVLCSPSPGLCSQYKSAFNNAMIVLKQWLSLNEKPDSQLGKAVLGEGQFSYCIYSMLRDFNNCKENILCDIMDLSEEYIHMFELSRKIVSEMLLVIPRTLHNNCLDIKDKNNRFLQKLQKNVEEFHKQSINKRKTTVEPFNSQVALLSNSIRCVIDVVKIDSVISVNSRNNLRIK